MRRSGFTDDDDVICKIMMARWADPDVEGEPVNASKVASFADMARAVRESEWLAERDAKIRAEAKEAAELECSSQVKKYADLVEAYRESNERVQANAIQRVERARRSSTGQRNSLDPGLLPNGGLS